MGNAMTRDRMRTIVAFTIVLEIGTAVAALAAPALVVQLLFGAPADATTREIVRCFGIALLALAAAWWPDQAASEQVRPPFRGRLVYNVLIACYLAYLGSVRGVGGLLLWPAVVLHGAVALLIVSTWRAKRA